MFEIRNTTNTTKRVQLQRVSDEGTTAANVHSGAVFHQDPDVGACLAPAPTTDRIYFNEFPLLNEVFYFNIEVNGVLYETLWGDYDWWSFWDVDGNEMEELWNKLIIHKGDNGSWLACTFKNATNEPMNVKLHFMENWKDETDYTNIVDDGRNTTIKYHANGVIEFDLAPEIPWDEVPEEDKFIAKVHYEQEVGLYASNTQLTTGNEWTYFDFIIAGSRRPTANEYLCIDWGDGSGVNYYRLSDYINNGSNNVYANSVSIYKEMPTGDFTMKVWSSLPAEFFMLQNVTEVINWGNYVFEEIYGIGTRNNFDRGDGSMEYTNDLFKKAPPGMGAGCTFVERYELMCQPCETYLNNFNAPYMYSSIFDRDVRNFTQGVWHVYGSETNFLSYYNFDGKFGEASVRYGKYPEDFPCEGFEDLDQLLIHLPGKVGGLGMRAGVDWFSCHPDLLIGSVAPENESDYISWFKDEVTEDHYFLLDIAKYKDEGKLLDKFLAAFRVWFDDEFFSGLVPMNLIGWMGNTVRLENGQVINKPTTASYEARAMFKMKTVQEFDWMSYRGERIAFLHYDTYEDVIVPKTTDGNFSEIYTHFNVNFDSLDVVFATGHPGSEVTFPGDVGVKVIGDSGYVEHVYDSLPTGYPVDFTQLLPSVYYRAWDQTLRVDSHWGFDYRFMIAGEPASDFLKVSDGTQSIPIPSHLQIANQTAYLQCRHTSARTGNEVLFAGPGGWGYIIPFAPSDSLIISFDKNQLNGEYNPLVKIAESDWRIMIRYVTPGEYNYSFNPSSKVSGGGTIYYDYDVPPKPMRPDGINDTQLMEIIFYKNATKQVARGELTLMANMGTIVQKGTMFSN